MLFGVFGKGFDDLDMIAFPAEARHDRRVDFHRRIGPGQLGRGSGRLFCPFKYSHGRGLRLQLPAAISGRMDRIIARGRRRGFHGGRAPDAAGIGAVWAAVAIFAVYVLLNRRIVEDIDRLSGVDLHGDLFARGHGFRADRHGIQRVDAAFRCDEVFLLGFAVPERPQPQRVHAEDNLIAQARHHRRRTLGEGAESLPQFGVHLVDFRRALNQIVLKGREDMLHRLDEIQAMAHAKRVDRAIHVLRVGAVLHHWDIQHFRFNAEARNRVEFAIVLDQVEGLGPLKNRICVGAVARVAHCHGRGVIRIPQFRIIAAQDFDCALHLVDDAMRRE